MPCPCDENVLRTFSLRKAHPPSSRRSRTPWLLAHHVARHGRARAYAQNDRRRRGDAPSMASALFRSSPSRLSSPSGSSVPPNASPNPSPTAATPRSDCSAACGNSAGSASARCRRWRSRSGNIGLTTAAPTAARRFVSSAASRPPTCSFSGAQRRRRRSRCAVHLGLRKTPPDRNRQNLDARVGQRDALYKVGQHGVHGPAARSPPPAVDGPRSLRRAAIAALATQDRSSPFALARDAAHASRAPTPPST